MVKIGEGEQSFSSANTYTGKTTVKEGQLMLVNSSGGAIYTTGPTGDPANFTNSYVDVESGATLLLDGPTGTGGTYEWVRYLTGAGTVEFDGTGDHNIQLGLLGTDDGDSGAANIQQPDFTGTIRVNNTNYIKVQNDGSSGETWEGHQIISKDGAFVAGGGANVVVKEGDGRLELAGDNSGFTGTFRLDDGTLVLNKDVAMTNDVDVRAGKIAIGANGSRAGLTTANGTGKTMIGGTGTYTGDITIDDAYAAQTFRELDPGIGPGASLSNTTSPWQVAQGIDPDGGGAADFDNIGTFTVDGDFDWGNGGIYNWEISDFGGSAGTDWDLFKFNSTNPVDFTQGEKYTIRIFGITPTTYSGGVPGTAGGEGVPANWDYTTREFEFLAAPGSGGFRYDDGGGGGPVAVADGYTFDTGFFDIDDTQFNWLAQDWNGVWNVKYKSGSGSGSLYLVYSAVPEPSTYVMVVGVFFLPIWNFLRRRRSRRKEDE